MFQNSHVSEPGCFNAAAGRPHIDEVLANGEQLYAAARAMEPREFLLHFRAGVHSAHETPDELPGWLERGARHVMHERPPWEADAVVVEGVGGLLVPLSPHASVRDLARALALPVVVAARPGLGTINHTLLTLEAARAAGLDVRAVVLTPWPEEPSAMERSNAETIAALGEVPVAYLPRIEPGAPAALPIDDWIALRDRAA